MEGLPLPFRRYRPLAVRMGRRNKIGIPFRADAVVFLGVRRIQCLQKHRPLARLPNVIGCVSSAFVYGKYVATARPEKSRRPIL